MSSEDSTKHEVNLKAAVTYVLDLVDERDLAGLVGSGDGTEASAVPPEIQIHLSDLRDQILQQHPADIAATLEALPLNRREVVWDLIPAPLRGEVLMELSEAVREHLLRYMTERDIVSAVENLDSDQIAYLAPSLPRDTVLGILAALDKQHRTEVQTALSAQPGSVGALMEFDMVTVRDDVTLDVVLRYLRKRKDLDQLSDQLFVVDRKGVFKGLLSFTALLRNEPETNVQDVLTQSPVTFLTDDQARDAVAAFGRYDLIAAPVVNNQFQLVGIISVDAVVDFINESAQREQFTRAGLRDDEDLFGPIRKSGINRWVWLAINLMTAILASRVIGMFEPTIERLVALAALMPIVASIGGNTGNQTAALMIRGLALKQVDASNIRYLVFKEIGISLINGLLWGGVAGLVTFLMYAQHKLALVMLAAMILNLLLASIAGVFVPFLLQRMGRDPAFGSSVVLTAITDSMGFLIFLGLATVFLT